MPGPPCHTAAVTAPPPHPCNTRDVGGLPVAGGGVTRSAVLLRGDAPYAGDVAPPLAAWPPQTVIDLRTRHPDDPPHPLAGDGTDVHHLSLSVSASVMRMAAQPGSDLSGIYCATARSDGADFARLAALVADAPGPVLVHCTAGKDRTGMLVATLLDAVGVERAVIAGDYRATGPNMPGVVSRLLSTSDARERHLVEGLIERGSPLLDVCEPALLAFLDILDTAHGGAAGWLRAHGLPQAVLDRLRERLVGDGVATSP